MDVSRSHSSLKVEAVNGRTSGKEGDSRNSIARSISGLSNGKLKETVVALATPRQRGCYFTRTQVYVFTLAFFLAMTVVVILVTFLSNNANLTVPGHPKSGGSTQNNYKCECNNSLTTKDKNNDVIEMTSHRPTVDPLKDDGEDISTASSDKPELGIRLPGDILPIHYDLDLDINLNGEMSTFTGSVKIHVYVQLETDLVVLHVKPSKLFLEVFEEEVFIFRPEEYTTDRYLQNISVPITNHFKDSHKEIHAIRLKTPLIAGTRYIIYFRKFKGFILRDLQGLYLSSYRDSTGQKKYLVASQLQATDARKVFPCFDEPAMKATFAVSMTHSSKYVALGNMARASQQCIDDCSRVKDVFQPTPIMSTYLLAFIVSEFEYTEKILHNNYTLRMWSQPDLINQTYYALDFSDTAYEYFTDYFQMPDVVTKADHVAVPDFSGGAMENWGLVIYRETSLLYDPDVSPSNSKYMVTLIVAHEIAHTWFGNMVTMRWWDDLWINEGFASTLMYFAMDYAHPEWHVLEIVVVEDMFPVMVKDALVTSHPVSTNIFHPDEIAESFDQISYNKGMAILRMLETFLGKDGFRRGLQMYVSTYKYQNADRSELWQTFTEAVNGTLDVTMVMDTWTRQMGYPVIHIRRQNDHFLLEQERFLIKTETPGDDAPAQESPFGYRWMVPFTYLLEGDNTTKMHWLNMEHGKIKRPSNGWILGNVNFGGFYRVNYDLITWQLLANQLEADHGVFGLANRAGLIGDAFNLARAGILDYGLAFNLTTYFRYEENYVPWKAFLDCLEFIRGMLSKRSAYVLLEKYIGELIAPVFQKIGAGDEGTLPEMYVRRSLLRTGCDVGVPSAIAFAKKKFRDWMTNGTRLAPDFAQVIYAVGVREGSVDEWDHVWMTSQMTQSPSEREIFLEALAHTQKPWLLWRYANWIFDEEKIKMQDVRLVISYFSNTPLGRMIALHFLMNRWDELNDKFGDDTFIIREMIGLVTQYVNTEFELNQLEALFREKPPKGARKGADSALDLIRTNIMWMNANYDVISNWLETHVESSF